ncbi:unnamed protein product, partial [Mesorhabditis spiculigera]
MGRILKDTIKTRAEEDCGGDAECTAQANESGEGVVAHLRQWNTAAELCRAAKVCSETDMRTALLLLGFIAVAASLAVQPQRDLRGHLRNLRGRGRKRGRQRHRGLPGRPKSRKCAPRRGFLKDICEKALKEAVSELVTWIKQKATPRRARNAICAPNILVTK